jgi:signal transduction histidine kinase/DNA-binding response OmpR family regulator
MRASGRALCPNGGREHAARCLFRFAPRELNVSDLSDFAERGKIWILEDSPLEGEMARRALSATHDVEVFTDGSVLLERSATARMPDLIVLDWQLPGVSGLEVCRTLRATHDGMTLPLLMLTVFGHKEDVVEALASGANDYVTKPYDIAELIARVASLVRTSRLHRAQTRRARQLALSADIGAALTKGKNLPEIAERSMLALSMHLDAASVEIWLCIEGELELLAWRSPGEAPAPCELVKEAVRGQRHVVRDGDGINDVSNAGASRAACCFAAMPLVVRDETVGVVAIWTAQPIGDSLGVLGTVADLLAVGVARARVEEERSTLLARERNSREEAEAANRSKDEFLAMVSHELRTPLNAITGWTGMLLRGGLEPEREKRALETIERNARSQAQLIDELLDISRIISGKLRVDVSNVDVAAIAERALESVRLAAESKGITIDREIDAAGGQLTGDPDRIQQIVWNLLTNAIKFTPERGRVLLKLVRRESGIEVSVSDSGQGIDPAFLPHVFDRFKQADGTMTRAQGGLGLGLAIVKHLVELHGGRIEAQSDGIGKGAIFRVTLPTRGGDAAAQGSPTFASSPPRFERPREVEGLRVLVVDDDEDARELLRSLLESCKISVTTASNAADAFIAVRARTVDVVLSDIAMPVEDGLSFIRRVRELDREEGGRVLAIALSAYARLEDRTRALRAGFNGHVAKPVVPSELLAVLSSLATR